jgi:TolA-binding protein
VTRLVGLVCVLAAAVSTAASQPFSERKASAIALFAQGQAAAAYDELRALEQLDPLAFRAENLDYALARSAESAGFTAAAIAAYQDVRNRRGPLQCHALMRLARLARESGNALLERLYLLELASLDEPLSPAAARRLAGISLEVSNGSAARLWLLAPSARPSSGDVDADLKRSDFLALAESFVVEGKSEAARPRLLALLEAAPNPEQPDDVSQQAAELLDKLDNQAALTVAEHLQRAAIFQYNREFTAARPHYEAAINAEPDGAAASEATFQIGRGFAQSGEYVEAIKWYERVLERYPKSAAAREALLQVASAYVRVGKIKEAETRYQQFIERYPSDEKLDRAYLNLVYLNRDIGEDQAALKWRPPFEESRRPRLPDFQLR